MARSHRLLLIILFVSITSFVFYGAGKTSLFPKLELQGWMLENEKNTIQVFHERAPLVVFVHNLASYRPFFSVRSTQVQQGTGSGFIWDKKGHIVTNYHVIQNADQVAVTLKDGKMLKAKVIGFEPRKDLAVLKVNPKHLPKMGFSEIVANSSKTLVGQKTIAIGNPFGLDHTLTVGSVSALNRSMETFGNVTIRDMIQTDAAINPGNSGGPLIDSRGYLIGMNTSIYSSSGSSAGIGFAVPSNTIQQFVEQIIQHGKVIQPGLGFIPFPERRSYALGIQSGVLIWEIPPGSEAKKSGLQGTLIDYRKEKVRLGDVIIGIDSDDIENFDDLFNALIKKKVGDRVTVKYLRNGKERQTKVRLSQIN